MHLNGVRAFPGGEDTGPRQPPAAWPAWLAWPGLGKRTWPGPTGHISRRAAGSDQPASHRPSSIKLYPLSLGILRWEHHTDGHEHDCAPRGGEGYARDSYLCINFVVEARERGETSKLQAAVPSRHSATHRLVLATPAIFSEAPHSACARGPDSASQGRTTEPCVICPARVGPTPAVQIYHTRSIYRVKTGTFYRGREASDPAASQPGSSRRTRRPTWGYIDHGLKQHGSSSSSSSSCCLAHCETPACCLPAEPPPSWPTACHPAYPACKTPAPDDYQPLSSSRNHYCRLYRASKPQHQLITEEP